MNQTQPSTQSEQQAKARRKMLANIYLLLWKTFATEQPTKTEPNQPTIDRSNLQ